MIKRRHFKQTESLTDRLATFAKVMRERAETMAAGSERNATLGKANDAETAIHMDQWISSSELKPPK